MSIQSWEEERQRIRIEEALLKVEEDEATGCALYTSTDEVLSRLRKTIEVVAAR